MDQIKQEGKISPPSNEGSPPPRTGLEMGVESLTGSGIGLSEREISVLRLVAQGLTSQQIARVMHLSVKTVDKMLSNEADKRAIYPKLGVRSRAQAAAWYVQWSSPHSASPVSPSWVDSFIQDLDRLRDIRARGNPDLTIRVAISASNRLRTITRRVPYSKTFRLLFTTLGWMLLELVDAYNEVTLPKDGINRQYRIIDEVIYIANICDDENLYGSATLYLADSYYVVKQYDVSLKLIQRALPLVRLRGPRHVLSMRTSALNLAYRGYALEFAKVENQIRGLIADTCLTDPHQLCLVLEGLGRCRGLLKKPEPLKVFDEAWNVCESTLGIVTAPFRAVQLVRSQLEVVADLGTTDKGFLEGMGRRCLSIAEEHGYKRHAAYIRGMLENE